MMLLASASLQLLDQQVQLAEECPHMSDEWAEGECDTQAVQVLIGTLPVVLHLMKRHVKAHLHC